MRVHRHSVSPVVCLAIFLINLLPSSGQTVEATLTVGAEPCAVAVNVVTNQVIEANCLGNTVGVISGFNYSSTAVTVGSRPVAIAVNFVTNKIYVANSVSNSVSIIDGDTFATTTVSVGANPRSIAINEITNQIYVANNGDNTVTVLDGVTNNTTTVSTGPNPVALAINPVTNEIYVATLGETVTIINGSTNQTTSVPVGVFPQSLAVNPVTNQIYVANSDSNTVMVIDGTTQQTTTLNVGLFPVAVAVNPATNQIYVADNHSLDVAVIDGLNGSTTTVALADNPTALTVDVASNQVYVTTAGGSVTVIDGMTNQSTATVPVGTNPLAVALNPVTNRLYTADSNSGTVTAVDAATNQTATIGLGSDPQAVSVNPATGLIYASNANDNTVSVIDGVTSQISTVNVGTDPTALAVNSASNQIYVANNLSNTASVIDGLTNEVTVVNVGVNPTAVAVNPVTNFAYVANSGSATVTAIDGSTLQATTLSVGASPSAVAVNSATDTIYVANSADNTVSIIDGVTGRAAIVNVGVKPVAIAINSVTNQIYVANYGNSSVTVINGATNQTTNVSVGKAPVAIAVNPITNRIYVANSGAGTVTVIIGASNRTNTVTVGSMPTALAANPVSNHIYVANSGSNTVTVIDGATDKTTTLLTEASPAAISINPITAQIYVTNSASDNLSVITEQRIGAVPLATIISALPSNQTVERSPTFVLSASSFYSPVSPPVQGILYQVDSWEGVWQAATVVGATYNANPSQLQLGPHVLYAFADNGLAAAGAGLDQNVVGSIAAYLFTVVQGQTTTEVTSSPNPSSDAQSVTLTASIQAVSPATGVPTGTVTFFDGATVLASGVGLNGSSEASFSASSLAPGTHSITVSYSGDANFVSSSSTPIGQVVDKGQTVSTLTSSLTSSVFGQGVTLTATVQAVAPATGFPTGTVTFLDGTTILGSGVALNGSGQASFSIFSLAAGTHSLTANYTGDVNFASSASTSISQTVVKGQSAATLTSSLNSSVFGQGVTLTATVQAVAPATGFPTGTVTFLDGTTVIANGVALNGSGQASFVTSALATGAHSITANYTGDGNFATSTSTSIDQIVVKGQSIATLASSLNSSVFGQGITLTVTVRPVLPATGTPTGTVTILDGTTTLTSGVVLDAGGQATLNTSSLPMGANSLVASYAGDVNFGGSTSAEVNETVTSAQMELTLSQTALTVTAGSVGSFNLNISSNGTLPSAVTFGCSGLPANATCLFSPSSLSPGALPGKVRVTISTDSIATVLRPRDGRGGFWYGFTLMGIVLASVERRSRRLKTLLTIATLLLLAVAWGCGSPNRTLLTNSSGVTPIGVSSVSVTANSGSSQATSTITLTVVQ